MAIIEISIPFHRCHSSSKDLLKVPLIFPENFRYVQNLPKNEFGEILRSYNLAKWQSIEISILFHTCVHLTLPFLIERIPENFSGFLQENLHFGCKNLLKLSVTRF